MFINKRLNKQILSFLRDVMLVSKNFKTELLTLIMNIVNLQMCMKETKKRHHCRITRVQDPRPGELTSVTESSHTGRPTGGRSYIRNSMKELQCVRNTIFIVVTVSDVYIYLIRFFKLCTLNICTLLHVNYTS